MLFIFGVRLFGRVDEVPGRFYVATEFYHIQFVPIVPMQTWLVLEQDADGWHGVKIPTCRKSVTVAWTRAAAVIVALVAGIWAVAEAAPGGGGDWHAPAVLFAMAVLTFAATKLSRAVTHADCVRACELARIAGFRERAIGELMAEFGEDPQAARGAVEGAAAAAAAGSTEPRMYFVSGRDRNAGVDVCVTVWATDDEQARTISAQRGIDVAGVECAAAPRGAR